MDFNKIIIFNFYCVLLFDNFLNFYYQKKYLYGYKNVIQIELMNKTHIALKKHFYQTPNHLNLLIQINFYNFI